MIENIFIAFLTHVPRRQQTSLRSGSSQTFGPSVPLRKEPPMSMTSLFFFFLMEVILKQGIGQCNHGNYSNPNGQSSSSLFKSTCTASYLLCKGIWKGGVGTEEMCLLHRAGAYWCFPLFLKSP